MAKIAREVKVGIIAISALFISIWGVSFLKGRDIFLPGYKLYGVYSRIDGLTEGGPIYYKGFKIGTVRTIDFEDAGLDKIIVVMSVDEDVKFPDNTVAQIYSLDLMGTKAISLCLWRRARKVIDAKRYDENFYNGWISRSGKSGSVAIKG